MAALTINEAGEANFAYYVTAGVLQGCPFSGHIFATAMDPILGMMEKEVDSLGIGVTRACADDVGAAMAAIDTLKKYKEVFDMAKFFSGLKLKPKKCILVLLAESQKVG